MTMFIGKLAKASPIPATAENPPSDQPIDSLANESALYKKIDELCTVMFDRWCDRRELLALVYLLHAWPLVPSSPRPVKTLLASLCELSTFHAEALDDFDRRLINDLQALQG
jgi:hypothetical protein